MKEAQVQVSIFFSVLFKLKDSRKAKGKRILLPFMVFCILLTELKNCRRQRHKARWLEGNWDWITEAWSSLTGEQTPKKAFSQSSISRLLQKVDLWHLKEEFFKALREQNNENKKQNFQPDNNHKKNPKIPLKHYSFDGKSRKGIVSEETGRTEIDLIFFDVEKRNVIAMDTLPDKEVASDGLQGLSLKEILKFIRDHWKQENCLHWVKDAILGEDGLRRMGNRGSRVLSFLKNIVVSIGYSIYKSVQKFVDFFDANPKKFTRALLKLD